MRVNHSAVLTVTLLLIASVFHIAKQHSRLIEASGVMRRGSDLLVVDDSVEGGYFRVPLPHTAEALIDLKEAVSRFTPLSHCALAIDLEGINALADGRIVVLSERLRSLIDDKGVVAEYPGMFSEFGGRGLEGVAVRSLRGGTSRVAVVWEGGYPELNSLPQMQRKAVGERSMKPVIYVHDLKSGSRRVLLSPRDAISIAELDVPLPAGEEPAAQRFRVPDLVWYHFPVDKGNEWGLIALMTSQNSAGPREYKYHLLMRFTLDGKPVGDPLDLAEFLPADLRQENWEGLSWYERGRTVVLVHEGTSSIAPHAFILKLPREWEVPASSDSGL